MTISPTTFRVAEPERRFRAFVVDRALAWSLFALAAGAAWWWFFRAGEVLAGIGLVAGVVLVVGLAFASVLGLRGTSPGRALFGLRVVDAESGGPVGLARGVGRTAILGVGSLPMFGLGVATLAWTAVEDRSGERRGWHDHVTGSVVVDIRPAPVEEEVSDERPRHVVNLTAMRLMPVKQTESPIVPAPDPHRSSSDPAEPSPARAQPTPAPVQPGPAPAAAAQPSTAQPPAAQQPEVAAPGHPGPALSSSSSSLSGPSGSEALPPDAPAPVTRIRPAAGPQTPSTASSPRHTGPLPTWHVQFDSGESFVVEGLGVVGRQPQGRPGEPVRHVVPLRSADMSISKTHAQFHLAADGALVVMDRGSTNGSLLIRKGVARELSPGRPATLVDGDRVRFGDREMRVSRSSS